MERVINERVDYEPGVDPRELCNVRYTTLLVERIAAALRAGEGHSGALLPVLDEYEPIGSTDRIAFYTSKLCVRTNKSHISHAVCDSKLEARIARALEWTPNVVAYVKNDRLYFDIPYQYLGRTHRYRPDFIVRLDSGLHVLVEGKGSPTEADDAKATAARRWSHAVTTWGQLGPWEHVVCYDPNSLAVELAQKAQQAQSQ